MVRRLLFLLLFAPLAFAQTPTTANIWISTSAGTCTRSASLVSFNASTACGSMSTAQAIASAGDTIIMRDGTYGAQTLSSNQKASAVSYYAQTACVQSPTTALTTPATCGVIINGALTLTIDKVHIIGLGSFTGGTNTGHHVEVNIPSTSTDVVFDNINFETFFGGGSHITVKNSDIGNGNECSGQQEDAFRFWQTSDAQAPTNDTILNSRIHDYFKTPSNCDGNHADGVQIFTLVGNPSAMLVDGNFFLNNDTSNIETEAIAGSWIVQNNYFGATQNGGNQLDIGRGACGGLLIQNNTFQGNNTYNNGVSCTGTSIIRSNLSVDTIGSCSVIAFSGDHNVQPSGSVTCGTSGKTCTPTWLNGAPSSGNGWNFRLSSSDTCAKDASNSTNFPTTDYYSTARPQGSAPDAGAFEITSAAGPGLTMVPGSLNFGSQSIGFTSVGQTLTVSNPGTSSATISTITISGTNAADYAKSTTCGALPRTLAAGASCTITVTFTPSAGGSRTATVTATDTPDTLTASSNMSGSGFDPTTINILQSVACGAQMFPGSCTIASTTANSCLVVSYNSYNSAGSTPTMTSVTDNATGGSDTFQAATTHTNTAGGATSWGYMGYSCNGRSGATAVTLTPSTSQTGDVFIWEVSNVISLDKAGSLSNQVAAGTALSPSITTTVAREVIFAQLHPNGGSTVSAIGSSFILDSVNDSMGWAHAIVAATGTYAPSWTQSPSTSYGTSIMSLAVNVPSPPAPSAIGMFAGNFKATGKVGIR